MFENLTNFNTLNPRMLLPPLLGQFAGNRSSEHRLSETFDNRWHLIEPCFHRINAGHDFVQFGDNAFLFVEGWKGKRVRIQESFDLYSFELRLVQF